MDNVSNSSALSSRPGQRIVPTSPQPERAGINNGENDEFNELEEHNGLNEHASVPSTPSTVTQAHTESYDILPAPQRVEPSGSLEGLYEQMDDSGESEDFGSYHVDLEDQDEDDEDSASASSAVYRPAFRPPSLGLQDASPGTSGLERTTAFGAARHLEHPNGTAYGDTEDRREGQTSTSAILIQDSPTPPLRPLASPQARLAASITGRCAALEEAEPSTVTNVHEDEEKTSLGELVCPICLGPPTPLVVTECGHTL